MTTWDGMCGDSLVPRVMCKHCGGSETGVFDGIPDDVYHADTESLSSSGVKVILDECPAQYRWENTHPAAREYKDYFDFGHAVHTVALGVGAPLRKVDADSWVSKAAKDARAKARAAGEVPLLTRDYIKAHDAAAALTRHRITGPPLARPGKPEQSIYWRDPGTGVLLRIRPDWRTLAAPGERTVILDVKTSESANPRKFSRSALNFRYEIPAAMYLEGLLQTGLVGPDDPPPAFVFAVVAKKRPHLVSAHVMGADELAYGHRQFRRAVGIYAECMKSGHWPGYEDDIYEIQYPAWVYKSEETPADEWQ